MSPPRLKPGASLATNKRCFFVTEEELDLAERYCADLEGEQVRELVADVRAARADVATLEAIQIDLCQYRDRAEAERDDARAALAESLALLQECYADLEYAGHQEARCEYTGTCRCGLKDLLQRIGAVLNSSPSIGYSPSFVDTEPTPVRQ